MLNLNSQNTDHFFVISRPCYEHKTFGGYAGYIFCQDDKVYRRVSYDLFFVYRFGIETWERVTDDSLLNALQLSMNETGYAQVCILYFHLNLVDVLRFGNLPESVYLYPAIPIDPFQSSTPEYMRSVHSHKLILDRKSLT